MTQILARFVGGAIGAIVGFYGGFFLALLYVPVHGSEPDSGTMLLLLAHGVAGACLMGFAGVRLATGLCRSGRAAP